jgi:phage baseplate assembly protein gpV
MAQQVSGKIELENGKQIEHFSSLKIWQDLFDHHSFRLVVPFEILEDKDEHFFNNSHKNLCGKGITFTFSPVYDTFSNASKSDFTFIFKAIITEIALRNEGELQNVFIIKGCSPTIMMEDLSIKRTFFNVSVGDVFSQVLNAYPGNTLKKNLSAKSSSQIKYVVQYNETNYEFLCRMADDYGEWFYYDGQQVVLGGGNKPEVSFNVDGNQSFDMSIRLKPTKMKMKSYDYMKDQEYEATSGNVDGLNQFGDFAFKTSQSLFPNSKTFVAEKPIYDQGDLNDLMKVKNSMGSTRLIIFRGSGEVPNISVGTVVHVKGNVPEKGGRTRDTDFGKYLVTEVEHHIDSSGNYSNEFKAVPDSASYPPPNPNVDHPLGQTEPATVTNNEDPDDLGRVKVKFYWAGTESAESDWIRVGTFYAGNGDGKGMFFVPEVGSQVLVDYELNRPEYPFIVTNLYPKKSNTRKMANKNEEKYIYTQAGNQIFFVDKDNENKIEITNINKDSTSIMLEFKENGKVTIKTDGKIEITAQDEISMSSKKKIKLDAPDIEISGTSSVKVKAAQVSMSGDSTAEVKGGASLKLQGAMTDVKADGIMTISGALVKIN